MNKPATNLFLNSILTALVLASPLTFAGVSPAAGAPTPQCTDNFNEASSFFTATLGADAPLERIPSFKGTISAGGLRISTDNQIVANGNNIFLNSKLSLIGIETVISAPVKICRSGNQLTARLIMSAANMKNKLVDTQVKKNFPKISDEIVIAITRTPGTNTVSFKSETYADEPATSVTLK